MSTAIRVSNLRKVFQRTKKEPTFWKRLTSSFRFASEEFEAVKDVSFSIEQGESVAFIGPNGAGKSTTIKMLTGILHPTSGQAEVLGYIPWEKRVDLSFRIGSVFGQKSQLWFHLPPMDTFELLSRIYDLDRPQYLRRRDELVELFELKDFFDVPTRKLSLGQRMRCEIAACLLHKPEIIFLDEPTIGLDPVVKASIRDLIRRAQTEDKVTIFLTSHDAGDIERICKRVIIVNHGQIIFDDTTSRLKREFLKVKEIDLKLSAPWETEFQMDGVKTLKASTYGKKFSLDSTITPTEKVVQGVLTKGNIEDITIQNTPMEEIIAQIYRREKRP